MSERIVVVGAGLSGLAAAAELAERSEVILVERLPSTGGVWGFDHPSVQELTSRVKRSAHRMLLGASALRWRDGKVLVLGPGLVEWLPADRLVVATGTRPATAAELGIAGGRLAGVFGATVAHHLFDDGHVPLGSHPVIVGAPEAAFGLAEHLAAIGKVEIVDPRPPREGRSHIPGVRYWEGYWPLSVSGTERVDRLTIGNEDATFSLPCDCVILAAEPQPWRNVEGAISDDSRGVVFLQPLDPELTATEVIAHAGRTLTGALLKEDAQ